MPPRDTSPRVGLWPTIPVAPAGHTIEPSVSVPIATWASDAATPAPEPDDDPHALRSRTWGLLVSPPTALHPLVESLPRKFAHSERFALPRMTAPAARNRCTSHASSAGRLASSAFEPAVVGSSRLGGVDVVLEQHGHALERAARPAAAPMEVARGGVGERQPVDREDGVDLVVHVADAVEVGEREAHG